jgi:hypothetical protein
MRGVVGSTVDRDGRYRDFEPIGAGGMGIVYLALDTELNRRVALKVVRPPATDPESTPDPFGIAPPAGDDTLGAAFGELVDRFKQEAWVTGALEHPGIVPVYELGETSRGVPYYTMRYVRGVRTLESELEKAETLADRLPLLEPFLRVCDAIRYAHARGVIHRDLKPANVGMGEFGEVFVLDWGLAKMRAQPDHTDSVWQERIQDFREARDLETIASAMGTPGYMSPEAALGDLADVDERSDVYSLGAILYRILTGRLPFRFDSFVEFLRQLREERPEPASRVESGVPEDLSRICDEALAYRKSDRFPGAGQLAAAIRGYQRESAVRTEVRAAMSEATTAFEGLEGLEGEVRLRQLDRVLGLCQRVLEQRPGHRRARKLLEECRGLRRRATEEREAALEEEAHERRLTLIRKEGERRRKLLMRAALAGLVVVLLVFGFVALALDGKRREAERAERRTHEALLALKAEQGEKTEARQAEQEARERIARLEDELLREKRAMGQALAEARSARDVAARVESERDRLKGELEDWEERFRAVQGRRARLQTELAEERRWRERLEEQLRAEKEARRRELAAAEEPEEAPPPEPATPAAGPEEEPAEPPPADPRAWTAEKRERLLALADQYVRTSIATKRDQILVAVRALKPLPRDEVPGLVEQLFELARSGPKGEGKDLCTLNDLDVDGTYYLHGAGKGKRGVLIGLHKQGETGKDARERWRVPAGSRLIGVFPNAFPRRSGVSQFHWTSRERLLLRILGELKRTYEIDASRIYLVGDGGVGGQGAWRIGCRHADLFAAVGCFDAPPPGAYTERFGEFTVAFPEMENLYTTPVLWSRLMQKWPGGVPTAPITRGLQQEFERLRKRHADGYPHSVSNRGGGSTAVCLAWLLDHRRPTCPRKLVWLTCESKRTFHWLRSNSIGPRIVATRSRRNRIEVETERTRGVSILLSEKMIDANRPVTVVANGEQVFRGVPEPDPAALLESILEHLDPERVYVYRIDLL